MDSNQIRQIKIYCPEHHAVFGMAEGPNIVCEIREHTLSNNFPRGEFWEYCCDCQTFFPSELEVGCKPSDTCRHCDRLTIRRFVCHECKIVAFDSGEETIGELYEINSAQGIKPNCPGCRKHFTGEKFESHICAVAETEFLTAREQCPFCKKPISKPPAEQTEISKNYDTGSPLSTNIKCPNCGLSSSEATVFCRGCGQHLNNVSPSKKLSKLPLNSVTQQQLPPEVSEIDASKKSAIRSNELLIMGLLIIGVVLITAILVIIKKNQGANYSLTSTMVNSSPNAVQFNNQQNSSMPFTNSRPKVVDSPQPTPVRKEVSDALTRWQSDAEGHNFSVYMDNYADSVDYYRVGRSDRDRVARDKQRAFQKYDDIRIGLKNIEITSNSEGNKATVILDKSWNFKNRLKATEGEVRQQISMAKINGRWYITGEKDLKVYYTKSY